MSRQAGFTLLEVLVSMVIMGVVLASMVPAFLSHVKVNTRTEVRSGAIAAAQQILDDMRSQDPATFPSTGSDPIEVVDAGSRSYDVTVSYCTNATYCPSDETKHIRVEVEYMGEMVYAVETVFTQLQ